MPNNQNEQNQAAKLQQLFTEVMENERSENRNEKIDEHVDEFEIDVLNLPPRSEVHISKSKKIKMTFNRPLIRFIFVIIFIICIVFGIYFYNGFDLFF